jgi:hypothetical protein
MLGAHVNQKPRHDGLCQLNATSFSLSDTPSYATIGTMSFGFSVGDLITALQLTNQIRTRCVNAPEQFKAISDE